MENDRPSRNLLKTLFLALLTIMIALATYIMFILVKTPEPVKNENPLLVQEVKENKDIVLTDQRIYYRGCGHTVSLGTVEPALASLNWNISQHMGWQLVNTGADGWILYREEDGLCPIDKAKRHLAIYKNKLAVYEGPTGYSGTRLRILEIDWQKLPVDIQQRLAGEGMEFTNEEAMWQTLDSFDEYL